MIRLYFDSSVYTKIFKIEDGSESTRDIISLSKTSDFHIFMSTWVINETISAIDSAVKKGHLTLQKSLIAIGLLIRRTIEYSRRPFNIEFVPVEDDLINASRTLIYHHHLSADDALHVYTAYMKDCEYFVTDDDHIKSRVHKRIALDSVDNKGTEMHVIDITNEKDVDFILGMVSKKK